MLVLSVLRWPILERIPLGGDFAVSPHGISIAVGFLVGAQLLLRRAQKRGLARRPVAGIPELVQTILVAVAIGTIIGARFFYILTHVDEFRTAAGAIDVVSFLKIWEGGLSLLGGIAGGLLAAVPYMLSRRLSIPLALDSSAPGLAAGIFIGRIGDLVIGEHLGAPTSFFLGWRCSGNVRDAAAPYPYPGNPADVVQGCYDVALHQTALYDFLAGGIVLAVLLLLERRPRFDGFFMLAFVGLYGVGRFLTDFARESEALFSLGGVDITGSQVAILGAIAAGLVWFLVTRPDRKTPYGWDPPAFEHGWGRGPRPSAPSDAAAGGHASGIAGETEPGAGNEPDGAVEAPEEGKNDPTDDDDPPTERPPRAPQDPHSERSAGGYPSPDGAR